MSRNRFSRKSRNKKKLLLASSLIMAICFSAAGLLFFEMEKPTVTLTTPISILGNSTELQLEVSDRKSGIRATTVKLKQGNHEKNYLDSENGRLGYGFNAGPAQESKTVLIDLKDSDFKDGNAQLTIRVEDFSFAGLFKGNQTELITDLTIDTTPPALSIIHSTQYIQPGGTGLVVYRVSDPASNHGVYLNNHFFKGFQLHDEKETLFGAYVALKYNAVKISNAEVTATDRAGNRTTKKFFTQLKKAKSKPDRINVGDRFLERKLPEMETLYPEMVGSLLEKYLYVNEEIRKKNNSFIKSLCEKPENEKLWAGRFLRMPGATRAEFADHRTYYYKNRPIDKQTHLGVDLASTKQADVDAANRGKVIFADYLGIYGNTIVLDHGQGVFSLYSHLTQIDVTVGDVFSKGDRMGSTGNTGMSGGDHLHFSILVNGIFVNPVEWWDSRWVALHLSKAIKEFTTGG